MTTLRALPIVLLVTLLAQNVHSWSSPRAVASQSTIRPPPSISSALFSSASASLPAPEESATSESIAAPTSSKIGDDDGETVALTKKEKVAQQAKEEGGFMTTNTKFGFLNPYGVFYLITSVALGLVWYGALWGCQLLYILSRGRFDRRKRLVNFASQVWGETLAFLTRNKPEYENREKLLEFFKKGEAAMFVANHNSWLDIPYVGHTIGWRNYKLISKAELGKVPILGKSIKIGGHIMVDRSNRRSQIATLRQGMDLLKNGVHLCTFPEGTRAKAGRLLPFKNGAFKMAHKVGAPIIPLSIVGSAKTMPYYWLMPFKPSRGVAKVVIHDPISSKDKTEAELAQQVRETIIAGLPEDQRPLEKEDMLA